MTKEERAEYTREYQKNYQKMYCRKHKQKRAEEGKKYRAENIEKQAAYHKQWRESDPAREARRVKEQDVAERERNRRSKILATNHSELWTLTHDKLILSTKHPLEDLPELLGRTRKAIRSRLQRLRERHVMKEVEL